MNTKALTLLLLATLIIAVSDSSLWAQSADKTSSKYAIPETDKGLPGAGPIRRYEWFQNLWQRKRSTWATQVQQDQNAVVFLGDSITQGWGDTMGNSFGDLKVANRGISGDTTRGMLIRLQEDVLSLNPTGVVMLMGTNDLEEKAEPETIAANVKLIIKALKKHNSQMPIILCKVFPSSATKARPADKITKINELCATLVKGDSQITVLDTWLLYADENGDAKKEEFPDLLHPNKLGYAKWAAALRPVFATHSFLDTKPEVFELEPGYISLFNGKDLTGWGFRKTAPRKKPKKTRPNALLFVEIKEDISFDGKTESNDHRFAAINGRLVVTTPAEGRRIQQLWTTAEFDGNFILKLDFRATPNADSGVFIRKPQLQCRDFILAGPYTDLKEYRPQDWNELEVVVKDGVATATCNGELLTDNMAVPSTGPIGLEGDRGQLEYRHIRIKKLN
ncbi:MAG: GDSL-type esterase/lipase family protein [Pirellulales bacterium]